MKQVLKQFAVFALGVISLVAFDKATANTPTPPPGVGAPPVGSAPAMTADEEKKLLELLDKRAQKVLAPAPDGQRSPYREVAGNSAKSPCAPGDELIGSKYDPDTNRTFHMCKHLK